MDWDVAVLVLFLVATVVGFAWRRTRSRLLYYAWLGIVWVEVQARKVRDRRGGDRSI